VEKIYLSTKDTILFKGVPFYTETTEETIRLLKEIFEEDIYVYFQRNSIGNTSHFETFCRFKNQFLKAEVIYKGYPEFLCNKFDSEEKLFQNIKEFILKHVNNIRTFPKSKDYSIGDYLKESQYEFDEEINSRLKEYLLKE
jgi:hypothetical protein